jgi:hypothetical protein
VGHLPKLGLGRRGFGIRGMYTIDTLTTEDVPPAALRAVVLIADRVRLTPIVSPGLGLPHLWLVASTLADAELGVDLADVLKIHVD